MQGNIASNIASGFLHYLAGLLIFIYYYHNPIMDKADQFFKLLSICVLSSITIVVILIYVAPYFFGTSIYIGLATQILIVVFAYSVHKKNFLIAILTFTLILASGKRGVIVALLGGSFLVPKMTTNSSNSNITIGFLSACQHWF